MARSKRHTYIEYPLLTNSTPLQDLDGYCQEWGGISRADATRQIITAWSKARHGEISALGAMGISLSAPVERMHEVLTDEHAPGQRQDTEGDERTPSASRSWAPSRGNAHLVHLDL